MGDVVSLVEKASEQIDQEDAEKLQKKLLKGKFSLQTTLNNLIKSQKWVEFKAY